MKTDGGLRLLAAGLLIAPATLTPAAAQAQSYAIGQRVECDPLLLKKFWKPGVVMAPNPGEKFNGVPVGTPGGAYRVKLDDGPVLGSMCPVDNLRPAQGAAAVAPVRLQPPANAAEPRFGTRSARTCAAVRAQPGNAQIAALVQCDAEGKRGDLIYLLEHVTVQSGGARRYSQFADGYATGIDTAAAVLPIRGGFDAYQCAALSRFTNVGTVYDTDNTGRNCVISPERNLQGTCFRTTFGDWRCHLNRNNDSSLDRRDQPPPR